MFKNARESTTKTPSLVDRYCATLQFCILRCDGRISSAGRLGRCYMFYVGFYPRDALLARYALCGPCLSIRPSVQHKSVFYHSDQTQDNANNLA